MSTTEEIVTEYVLQGRDYDKAATQLGLQRDQVYQVVQRHREELLEKGRVPEGYKVKSASLITDKAGKTRQRSTKVVLDAGSPDRITHIPDPKLVTKTTTLFDGERNVERQWVMEKPDLVKVKSLWEDYAHELIKPIEPGVLLEPLPPQILDAADTCAVYPIGDYHVGMMAWGLETRSENYDIRIAEQLLARAAEHLMKGAPPSEQCVLAFMGDFVHFDSFRPETPANRHLLDADTRFGKVGRIAMRIIRHIIAAARRYHRHVHVIFLRGNHDPAVAELMNVFLGEMYADEPTVTVDTSPSYFRYYEFGKNLWGFVHGDKVKPDHMPMIMANDMREAWGRTTEKCIFTAHVHHESRKDRFGVAVEQVPVIIPNDAYASDAGYRSRRLMQVIAFDREWGEIERHTYNPSRFFRSPL